jgi:hypothetical protein
LYISVALRIDIDTAELGNRSAVRFSRHIERIAECVGSKYRHLSDI